MTRPPKLELRSSERNWNIDNNFEIHEFKLSITDNV